MSKRTYQEICQRKSAVIKQQEKKTTQQAKRQKKKEDKILTDDQVWLKGLTLPQKNQISIKLLGRIHLTHTCIDLSGGIKKFRLFVEKQLPELYAETLQAKSRARLARDIINPLKLYYLNRHPIFYMSNGACQYQNVCILEFKFIPESWWSNTFEAVLINFTTKNEFYQQLLKPLLEIKFTFKKVGFDWNICEESEESTILTQTLTIQGIEWDFFWANLCDLTRKIEHNGYLHDRFDVLTECPPFKIRENYNPEWIYHYQWESIRMEYILTIPDYFYPKNEFGISKIVYDPLFQLGAAGQKCLYDELKKAPDSNVVENMTQRIEYLEACDFLQRHPHFLKPLGQHKEYILAEFLSFLF